MKYLEGFNWFRKDKLKEISIIDIQDICLELQDAGMNFGILSISREKDITIKQIKFIKNSVSNEIYWDDVKDCILRLKDYLGNNFVSFSYQYYVHYYSNNDYRKSIAGTQTLYKISDIPEKWQIYSITIEFKYKIK